MIQSNTELNELAKRYVWWESVEWSYRHPDIFLAQVMNLGSWKDIQMLCRLIKMNDLKKVLNQPPTGIFTYRSWDYWHLKLGFKTIPPLPERNI